MPGRPPISFDVSELTNVVERLERENSFSSRSALYQAIADTDWAMSKKMKPPFIYLQIKKNNIPVQTPLGERGRKKGVKVERINLDVIEGKPVKGKRGSMKRAIREKCFDCCGRLVKSPKTKSDLKHNHEVKMSVRTCHITECSLHPFRPLKTAEEKGRIPLVVTTVSDNIDDTPSVLVPDNTVWEFENAAQV